MSTKKYYWLKLPKDFFRRHDIRIIENMPNGREYLLIYIKLMTESIPHSGRLRFSDEIPYTPEMLATVLGDDPKKIISAIDALKKWKLLKYEKDRTIFLPEVPKMMGEEGASAKRMRKFRVNTTSQSDKSVTQSKSQKKEQDKEQEPQEDKDISDDDACAKEGTTLDVVDTHRLSTVFGDYSAHTEREYLKLKAQYSDKVLHAAIEKTWVLGGKTIEYTKKILEETRA